MIFEQILSAIDGRRDVLALDVSTGMRWMVPVRIDDGHPRAL